MTRFSPQSGQMIDQFKVKSLLHRGGMAQLWLVETEDQPEPLLMKIPILSEGEDAAAIVGFEMEQMILPRLKGVHVPRFVANGEFEGQPYIVMEKLAGDTLLPLLGKLPLPVEEVANIGSRVADALVSLHAQQVVHLDIKPSNIMFRPTGEAVLIDYGLARHRELPDLMKEEFRLPYGTAPYMAPEQVMGVRHDPRSDVFALGVLMYFFATGTRPFGDPQTLKGLKKRIWRDPVPPIARNASLPSWLQEIILRCLEVNANRRYPTAAHLAHDLRHPDQVEMTARASKSRQDSFFTVLKRRGEPLQTLIDSPAEQGSFGADAPIVVLALDLTNLPDGLGQSLREAVESTMQRVPGARLACLNVLKLNRVALDTTLDEAGRNKHMQRLVALKDWVLPLQLKPSRVTFHVLEAVDPAEAILEYCQVNNVDHVVMGARENSTIRKLLGSVSGKVAAEAPCSVTVVRSRAESHGAGPRTALV